MSGRQRELQFDDDWIREHYTGHNIAALCRDYNEEHGTNYTDNTFNYYLKNYLGLKSRERRCTKTKKLNTQLYRPERAIIATILDLGNCLRTDAAKALGITKNVFVNKLHRSCFSIRDLITIAQLCGYEVCLVKRDKGYSICLDSFFESPNNEDDILEVDDDSANC